MTAISVTSIYAALLALLFTWLSLRVIFERMEHRVSLGDDGHKGLLKRMRAQANCAEYIPMGLILLALLELQGVGAQWVHLLGATLLIGRLAHAYGFSRSPQLFLLRRTGMVLTFTQIVAAACALLYLGLFQ